METTSFAGETLKSGKWARSGVAPTPVRGRTGKSPTGSLWATVVALLLLLVPLEGVSCDKCASTTGTSTDGTTAIVCENCAAGCQEITSQVSVCVAPEPIATECSHDQDVKPSDNDCACEGRTCAAGQVCYSKLAAWDEYYRVNRCGLPAECVTNSDCASGKVCIPPFNTPRGLVEFSDAIHAGNPGGVCIVPECQTDADCTAAPCGVCALRVTHLSVNSGLDVLVGVTCGYGMAVE